MGLAMNVYFYPHSVSPSVHLYQLLLYDSSIKKIKHSAKY